MNGLIILIIVMAACLVLLSWIFGAEGLELTAEQIADERKTQICIIYNISNQECFLVYGDIDNDWEPEK